MRWRGRFFQIKWSGDIFICDINMPNLDGFGFLNTIINNETYAFYKFTPRIILSSEYSEDMKAKGKELGAAAWLIKPFQKDQLIDDVSKLAW